MTKTTYPLPPGLWETAGTTLSRKTATAGFDGFLDKIASLVRDKPAGAEAVHFQEIKEFGEYVLEKSGGSFSLEVEERRVKIGGNMPITAHALGQLGVRTHCIGALGYPQIHPAFRGMSSNCQLHSFSEPGTSTAFEFNGGKMMLAEMAALNALGWGAVRERVGLERIRSFFRESELFCLLNWSEIDASTDIWKGLLEEVLPQIADSSGRLPIALFDLSDCSKRSDEAILEMLGLLQQFGRYAQVTLSLNRNEAGCLHRALFGDIALEPGEAGLKAIFEKIEVATLVLHHSKSTIALRQNASAECDTFFVAQPKISTGAGDHFNAGFAAAQLLGLELGQALTFANAVSGCYVRTGESPRLADVARFLLPV